MANNISSANLIDLDFDTLKQSLKDFMKSQSVFKDYDFEGSNLSVLLDVLAYNTFKNAFFYNMNVSEAFIDSAQLRDSILSIAKALNYTPRSARSSKARVSVSFTATGENQPYIIPKGSSFATLVKNESFMFSIPESIICTSSNNTFSFETDIYEGPYLSESYVFDSSADNKRYRINNKNVDTESLTVSVFEDGSVVASKYKKATTLLDLDETSKVFFLQASENGYYEVLFGDNNIGRSPKHNSIVVLDYRVSAYERPNGATSFVSNFDPTGDETELTSVVSVTTVSSAQNGAAPEDNESVRYYAPRHFQIQERTIVPTDYEIALLTQFPEINAVSCIGGEDRNPPQFGKIFIAIDLKESDGLPDSKLQSYYNFVRSRSPLKPVFIEPEFTYYRINSKIRYNSNITTLSTTSIETVVTNSIMNWNSDNLNDFGVIFRGSKFSDYIDSLDVSFLSNKTNVYLYKKISPTLGELQKHKLDFGIAIENNFDLLNSELSSSTRRLGSTPKSVESSLFRYNGTTVKLEDDGAGSIRMVKFVDYYHDKLLDVGTVDYDTGMVMLDSLRVDFYEESYFKIYVKPADPDIVIPKDTLSFIESDEIHLEIEPLKE